MGDKAWIVAGERGEYSDWSTWPVAVFDDKDEAGRHAEKLQKHVWDVFERYDTDRRIEEHDAFMAELKKFDRSDAVDGYDQPMYTVVEAPWFRKGEVDHG